MASLPQRDVRRARELASQLARYDTDGPSVLACATEALHELLGAEKALAYVLRPDGDDRVSLERLHGVGIAANSFDIFSGWLTRQAAGWASFHPVRPERAQRNRVLTIQEIGRISRFQLGPSNIGALYGQAGIDQREQLRVLICDGPALLAWLGVFQPTPFDGRQQALMKQIVPALRKRLAIERKLATADTFRAAFAAALEQLGAAAFLIGENGRCLEANAAGKAALAGDPRVTRAALAEAARRGASVDFEVTPVRSRGSADAALLVRRSAGSALDGRLHRVAAHWQLTPKQTQILRLIAEGNSNRTVAAILEIGERTVETHLTAIYDRAQVEGRSELVARVWQT